MEQLPLGLRLPFGDYLALPTLDCEIRVEIVSDDSDDTENETVPSFLESYAQYGAENEGYQVWAPAEFDETKDVVRVLVHLYKLNSGYFKPGCFQAWWSLSNLKTLLGDRVAHLPGFQLDFRRIGFTREMPIDPRNSSKTELSMSVMSDDDPTVHWESLTAMDQALSAYVDDKTPVQTVIMSAHDDEKGLSIDFTVREFKDPRPPKVQVRIHPEKLSAFLVKRYQSILASGIAERQTALKKYAQQLTTLSATAADFISFANQHDLPCDDLKALVTPQ